MSIFIPYNPDSPTAGSSLLLHPDFVTAGSQISVQVQGTLTGAVTVTEDAPGLVVTAAASSGRIFSGTFTSVSSTAGATDNANFIATPALPPVVGWKNVIARGTDGSNLFQLGFDTAGERDTFVSAYPDGQHTATLEYLGATYTASNFSWTSAGNSVARIGAASFNSFPVAFFSGDAYSLTIS